MMGTAVVPKVWQLGRAVVLGLARRCGVGPGQWPLRVRGDGVGRWGNRLDVQRRGLVSQGPAGHGRAAGRFPCHEGQ